ncbi:hypothetical protein EMCRGX_G034474 [Ephydatia muelleri]
MREFSHILYILSTENLDNSNLESIAASLHRQFGRTEHFRIGNALTLMLQHKDLLPLSAQRIAAIFLLYELYHSDPVSQNSFVQFFIELLKPSIEDDRESLGLPCGHSLNQVEKAFLCQLLSPTAASRGLFKKTPASIANVDPSSIQMPDIAVILASIQEPPFDFPSRHKVGMSTILADPDPTVMSRIDGTAAGQAAETFICGGDGLTDQVFEPGFLRPVPPLYVCEDEVTWLNPSGTQYSIQWDDQMCVGGTTESKRLITKAHREALTPAEHQILLSKLESDPKMVYQIGLSPQKLPQLVERNPTIAIEALYKMSDSPQISEYFITLVNMDMSLHSMEVMNVLTTRVEVSTEFLHLYITNCIKKCRDIQDKSFQSRLVRLLCVFLQSLLRNKIINVQEELVEIQSFCVEFSKVKEASALYKLLKSLESGGSEVSGNGTNISK